ncbi:MAG: phenylalanine--tRNA ligase subunit beta, partial [Pseudomonadota bacterium]
MKISEAWLREWVDVAADTDALAHQLTMAGLEVEAVETAAGSFDGVVVGEIVDAQPHPNADKLQVCSVNDGSNELLQIVCGAPNARVGLKAPLARVGAVLPGEFAIKEAKLRDVVSQGMLCAASELELSEDKQGLLELPADAPVGESLREYLSLEDHTIEIGLTPNRSDCLSIQGIAREAALANQARLKPPTINSVKATIDAEFPVELQAAKDCPRYLCRVIDGVDLSRPTPIWMQEKLRRCGLRSIDPAVDITNFILLELGQPMHAFDLDKLQGGIVVRHAQPGEKIQLLNDQEIELQADNLVIADQERALALAGIMGGDHSAVSEGTTRLLLESAFFAPALLSGKARAFGLHTDSSHRFERGVDFELQRSALERATQLLIEVVGGSAGPVTEAVVADELPAPEPITLRRQRIPRLLGIEIEDQEVERMLDGLGVNAEPVGEGWLCSVPSWRFDLRIEADLLEEVGRLHGYNNLPSTQIRASLQMRPATESRLSLRVLRRALLSRDYHEAVTYSFVDEEIQRQLDPELEPVAVINPISPEHAVMRSTLLAGLLRAAAYNVKRQQPRVRLFETGLRFVPMQDGLQQTQGLALLATGSTRRESWSGESRKADFFDLKGDLEALMADANLADPLRFVPCERAGLHPGQSAAIERAGVHLGYIGVLHPSLQSSFGFEERVVVAELNLDILLAAAKPSFRPISRFPALRRDIAVVVDQNVAA